MNALVTATGMAAIAGPDGATQLVRFGAVGRNPGGAVRRSWSQPWRRRASVSARDAGGGARPGAPQPAWALRISVLSRGHSGTWIFWLNERSPRNTAVRSASGSTHTKLPDWPKWPKVPGEACSDVQCGDLSLRISSPRPQSLFFWRP